MKEDVFNTLASNYAELSVFRATCAGGEEPQVVIDHAATNIDRYVARLREVNIFTNSGKFAMTLLAHDREDALKIVRGIRDRLAELGKLKHMPQCDEIFTFNASEDLLKTAQDEVNNLLSLCELALEPLTRFAEGPDQDEAAHFAMLAILGHLNHSKQRQRANVDNPE